MHRTETTTARLALAAFVLATAASRDTAGAEPAPAIERVAWSRLVAGDDATPSACRFRWQDMPLNEAVERLRDACGTVVWIDRRLDPSTRVTADQQEEPIEQTLRRVAGSIGTKSTQIAAVHCLGPDAEALRTRLANRLEDIVGLPARQRRAFVARDAIEWPRLTEPRALIAAVLEVRGIDLADAERVPHDRWAAGRLPPVPLADQLTLLLAGFGLDWRVEERGRAVRLVPAESPLPVAARHSFATGRRPSAAELRRALGSTASLSVDRQGVTLSGSVEQHTALRRALTSTSSRPKNKNRTPPDDKREPSWARKRFTLRVEDQPATALLRSLSSQIGFEVRLLDGAEDALKRAKRVSLETREATLDELLEHFAEAAGVSITLRGDAAVVSPPASDASAETR